jgi:hypothetical protein
MEESIHCNTCNLDFKNNPCYKKHLKTIRHIERSTNVNIVVFTCICGRSYSYNQSLNVHQKTCEQYQTSDKESNPDNVTISSHVQQLRIENDFLREKHKSYEKELAELKAQVAILLDKHMQPSQNTNCNIDNQTNNNITININSFGNENTNYIDDKSILACISRVYKSIPTLLQKLHFDPEHPENHNIKITNKKLPYASVMGDDQKWKMMDRKDAIETMVLNSYNMLDEKYAENKDKFPASKQQSFEGFQSKFEAEDKDLMKQIKTEVDMMVLNR